MSLHTCFVSLWMVCHLLRHTHWREGATSYLVSGCIVATRELPDVDAVTHVSEKASTSHE